MNELQDNPPPSLPLPKARRSALPRIFFLVLLLLIAVIIVAGRLFLVGENNIWPRPAADPQLQSRVLTLEGNVQTLDKKLIDLGARVDSLAAMRTPAAAPSNNETQAPKTSAADLARMQSDLVALAAALNSLQAEVKQAGSTATAIRAETQNAIAETVAFMQLRAQAEAGHSFAPAFSAMQTAAATDPNFKEPLGKLAPYAEKGAPSLAVLRDQLAGLTGGVERAVAKAQAQNWWERILAELKGLVSIRPLHGTSSPGGILESMQADLARDDVAAALDEIKNLPPEAQKSLDDWRAMAEARRTIDDALRAMADNLIAGAHAVSAQPAQDKP